ncbi:MAG: LysM domain-containing protein, partial [Thermodesulfobacteriota bacterium]|nr:LysM domain-containing protein [Thermodesulfobacteriota bacterium]
VKPGDSLIRVAKGRYKIPQSDLYSEYLRVVKKMNPSIEDLNTIYPGQKIRLPVYSPEIVRKPIEPADPPSHRQMAGQKRINPVGYELGVIFSEMGEKWLQAGQHFIPLKSGGLIDLKAESFPIVSLQTGLRVIVDLSNSLPDRMTRLIESSRGNYRVVRLTEEDDLRSSLDKIIAVCSYPKVFRQGEALELGGDIHHRITGDWIITPPKSGSSERPGFLVINLIDAHTAATPELVKDYVKGLGVKIIDYPPGDDDTLDLIDEVAPLNGKKDPSSLVETVLDITKHSFTTHVKVPVYQGQEANFKLIVKADFLLKIKGKDALIDLTGLAPEIIALLREQQFSVLQLAAEKEPLTVIAKTLEFIDIHFKPGPHSFMAIARDDSQNITFTLPGLVFADLRGDAVLVTSLSLPDEIAALLSQRGYKIIALTS